jgi:hypothetical protein
MIARFPGARMERRWSATVWRRPEKKSLEWKGLRERVIWSSGFDVRRGDESLRIGAVHGVGSWKWASRSGIGNYLAPDVNCVKSLLMGAEARS